MKRVLVSLILVLALALPTYAQVGVGKFATTKGQQAIADCLDADGNNICLNTGSTILLPDGTVSAPSLAFENDTDSGLYLIGAGNIGMSVGGALVMDWEDTNAAGAGADLVTISSTLGIMDGSDIVRGLFVDLTNADHTGSGNLFYGIDIGGITGDAQATESAMRIGDGWDNEILFVGLSAIIKYPNAGTLDITDAGGVSLLRMKDIPIAGSGADLFELNYILNALNGSDIIRGLYVDIASANHSGSGNGVYGIDLDHDTRDAEATEIAAKHTGQWDYDFQLAGNTAANLGTPANGTFVYCTDCTEADPCAGSGTGAWAMRLNGRWDCN